jgi:hypothetical protein
MRRSRIFATVAVALMLTVPLAGGAAAAGDSPRAQAMCVACWPTSK